MEPDTRTDPDRDLEKTGDELEERLGRLDGTLGDAKGEAADHRDHAESLEAAAAKGDDEDDEDADDDDSSPPPGGFDDPDADDEDDDDE
jgi:hypothetical protein